MNRRGEEAHGKLELRRQVINLCGSGHTILATSKIASFFKDDLYSALEFVDSLHEKVPYSMRDEMKTELNEVL